MSLRPRRAIILDSPMTRSPPDRAGQRAATGLQPARSTLLRSSQGWWIMSQGRRWRTPVNGWSVRGAIALAVAIVGAS
jgi:hypothetical protein